MFKITADLAMDVIEYTFSRLPTKDRLIVVERLQRQTRQQRWQPLINDVRKRAAKAPVTAKEITTLCEEVRQRRHAKKH